MRYTNLKAMFYFSSLIFRELDLGLGLDFVNLHLFTISVLIYNINAFKYLKLFNTFVMLLKRPTVVQWIVNIWDLKYLQ